MGTTSELTLITRKRPQIAQITGIFGDNGLKLIVLYIDKHMEDHNLFQAICRVNRVESDRKEFGYIIDYKDLFDEIKGAVEDYTNGQYTGGAFSAFNSEDVAGLLKNRLEQGKKDLDEALELIEGICQYVKQPKGADLYFDYFVFDQATTHVEEQLAVSLENASKREQFYNAVLTLTNRYLAIATQMVEAGYTAEEAKTIHQKVTDYDELRKAIMLRSGDSTDLKQYNAMMRQLLDHTYRLLSQMCMKCSMTFLSLTSSMTTRQRKILMASTPSLKEKRKLEDNLQQQKR